MVCNVCSGHGRYFVSGRDEVAGARIMERNHRMNEMNREYPGGWALTDDSCMQYVRRRNALEFELIEYGLVSQDGPLCEVYTDIINLGDYERAEVEDILNGFGYAGVEELHEAYPSRDMANQVIAECIFEHFGSFSVEPLCKAVSEAFAQQTILDFLALHSALPEHHGTIEVSAEELVRKMLALNIGETLDFSEHDDGYTYGVARLKMFDAEMFLLNYYGGGCPFVIDVEWGQEALEADVLHQFKCYCKTSNVEAFFIKETPSVDAERDEVKDMRTRNREALLSKAEFLEQMKEGDASDATLSGIRDSMMRALGFDPVWRYPFCHDGGLGAVIVPVREGYLWLPYSVTVPEDNELYELDDATLLDAESCEYLLGDMMDYVEPLAAVMAYIARELRDETKKGVRLAI